MFKKSKMTTLVMAALAAMAGLIVVQGLMGSRAMKVADDADTVLYEEGAVPLGHIGEYTLYFYRAWTNVMVASGSKDNRVQTENLAKAEKRLGEMETEFSDLDKALKNKDQREALEGLTLGRLRIASKAAERQGSSKRSRCSTPSFILRTRRS